MTTVDIHPANTLEDVIVKHSPKTDTRVPCAAFITIAPHLWDRFLPSHWSGPVTQLMLIATGVYL